MASSGPLEDRTMRECSEDNISSTVGCSAMSTGERGNGIAAASSSVISTSSKSSNVSERSDGAGGGRENTAKGLSLELVPIEGEMFKLEMVLRLLGRLAQGATKDLTSTVVSRENRRTMLWTHWGRVDVSG